MTDSEEIIDILNNAIVCATDDDTIMHLEKAIKAVEKQIPQKPINKMYSFYPHSTVLKSKYGKCPVCKSIQVDDEYCANCGQKLDWGDKNEVN